MFFGIHRVFKIEIYVCYRKNINGKTVVPLRGLKLTDTYTKLFNSRHSVVEKAKRQLF